MNKREIITLLGGAAAWPLAVRAQQGERVRRIGVLTPYDQNDSNLRLSAFTQTLAGLGWTDGRNVRIDLRWGHGDIDRIRALAQELGGLQPDIILSLGLTATAAVQRETRAIPSPAASSRDSTNRAGTSPALPPWKPPWEASGLSYSRRLRPGSSGPQSCSVPTRSPQRPICLHLRRRPGHSRSSQSLRPFIATEKSKRPSSPLGASREAALSSCRIYSRPCIARRSYRRPPETTYRRSMRYLNLPET